MMSSPPHEDESPSMTMSHDPALVLDRVAMTYSVRSSSVAEEARGLRGLFGRFRGVSTDRVRALESTTLVVNRGESVGVIGTNGSGKSTLMKIITGQLKPSEGRVLATSVPVMLGVNAALVRQVSGEDNIRLGCLAMGMTPDAVALKRDQIVALSGLSDSALRLPLKSYSSGMAARLQFAIATSVDPDILVIDEALNTGDAQFKARTRRRLDELRAQAGCVLLVSHSMDTLKQMCTRIIWVEQGVVSMDGEPARVIDLYSRYTKRRAAGKDAEAADLLRRVRNKYQPTELKWSSPAQSRGLNL